MARKQRGVWLLTSGSYSSYRVHAAFESEEIATAARDAANEGVPAWSSVYAVEWQPLYDAVPERKVLYGLRVAKSMIYGAWTDVEEWQRVIFPWDDNWPRSNRPSVSRRPNPVGIAGRYIQVDASGTDREAVRKAFHERWAEIKAREEGL